MNDPAFSTASFVIPDDLESGKRADFAPAPGSVLNVHNPHCFGCGPKSADGLHLQVVAGSGLHTTAVWEVPARFEGGPGVIHGGILSSVFDEVMGNVPMLVGSVAVTAHLEVDFATPIPIGATLTIDARLIGLQRRKLYIAAEASIDGAAEPAATARGLFIGISPADHFKDTWRASGSAADFAAGERRP